MDRILEDVKKLSVEIGPRGAGDPGEIQARDFLENSLRVSGIETRIEPFFTHSSFSYPYGLIYFLGALAGFFLYAGYPFLSLLIGISASLLLDLENLSLFSVGFFFPRKTSHNVIGRIPAGESSKRRLILVAHYDSSRESPLFSPALVPGFRASFLAVRISILAVPLLAFLQIIFHWDFLSPAALLPVFVLGFSVFSLIHREITGRITPGANDNASGTAVLLALAREFRSSPLKNTELILLFSGAEEVGLVGMVNFLQKNPSLLSGSRVINLDSIGIGNLKYILAEGMVSQLESDPSLVAAAGGVARIHPGLRVEAEIFRVMSTDAVAALGRGIPAMTVMTMNEKGLIPNWHWRDEFEKIEPETLERAFRFVRELLRRLDAEG